MPYCLLWFISFCDPMIRFVLKRWNKRYIYDNLPVQKDENNIALVSGLSPVIFKIAVENKTPEEVMLDTINSERYLKIKL